MLACMVAGFWLANGLGRRAQLSALLHACLPPLLAFFFFTTGLSMRVQLLRKTWPTALTLFGARLAALWLGTYCGTSLATRATRGSAAHGAADERCGGRRC